jgi:hypothetical protein
LEIPKKSTKFLSDSKGDDRLSWEISDQMRVVLKQCWSLFYPCSPYVWKWLKEPNLFTSFWASYSIFLDIKLKSVLSKNFVQKGARAGVGVRRRWLMVRMSSGSLELCRHWLMPKSPPSRPHNPFYTFTIRSQPICSQQEMLLLWEK